MTSRNCVIVDSGAFCEVILFSLSPKNLLGNFFDSLAIVVANWKVQKAAIYKSSLQNMKSGKW
jgi:hypothetical protein